MVQVNPDFDLRLPGPKPVYWRINSAGGIEIDRSVGRSFGSVGEHKASRNKQEQRNWENNTRPGQQVHREVQFKVVGLRGGRCRAGRIKYEWLDRCCLSRWQQPY